MNLIQNWARQGLWCSSLSLSWALVARKLRTWLLYSEQPTFHVPIGSANAKQGYGCSLKIEQNLHKISHMQRDRIKPGWLLDRQKWGKKLFTVLPTHNPTKPNTKYRERTEKWVSKPSHWSAQKRMSGMESWSNKEFSMACTYPSMGSSSLVPPKHTGLATLHKVSTGGK